MIKFNLVIAAVSLVVVTSTMVVNRYRIVMMVVMVVIVVMIVVVLQVPICHSSSSVLLGVKVERGTHRWRIRRVYY